MKKRKREKEKIKGKEKVRKSEKKGGGERSITYDTATTMATKEERRGKEKSK